MPQEIQATAAQTPVYGGRGQPRKPRPAPLYTVKELIAALPASAWQVIDWREGTKGTMQIQAVAIRVQWAIGSSLHSTSHSRVHTGPEGWLLAERPVPETVGDEPLTPPAESQKKEEEQIKYWFSVLPPETALQRLVLLAHARWVIEQFRCRCQAGMRLRSLPGTQLQWLASPPGPGHAGLQFPHGVPLNAASRRGLSPPASREARCLECIVRCCSGCSRILSSGSSTLSRSSPSAPEETNRVVLDIQEFASTRMGNIHAVIHLLKIVDPTQRASVIQQLTNRPFATEDLPAYVEATNNQKTAEVQVMEQLPSVHGRAGAKAFTPTTQEPATSLPKLDETATGKAPAARTAQSAPAPTVVDGSIPGRAEALARARTQITKLKTACKQLEDYERWLHTYDSHVSNAEHELLEKHETLLQKILHTY
ncbi:MAG TPA: hypothetical protein VHZ51_23545 [Ktedonobacteraceae bacterium]|nr:hypothetical protein [Ktedonobacteraceae bacterium]